MDIKEATVY